MSSNSSIPETDSNGLSGVPGESERCPSNSDDLRRLRTGKRGRPPIDLSQKGLAERRRNQVRKAQRAYRFRKEEEAAFRMNYVQVLENRIRQMRQSFFELASHVEKAQITHRQPNRTYELQRIIRDFLSASQTVEPFGESQHNDGYAINDYPRSDPTPLNPVVSSNIYTSCQTNLPVPASVGQIETPMPIHAPPFGDHLFFPGSGAPIPRTFAQRLYFTCIKRAHGLLTNPHADGAEVARVFQYSFHYSDASTMISTFDVLLRTNADYRTAYVYNLGGAGSHYQYRQTDLDIVQKVSLGQETSAKSDDETWFDPRDIEGWLEENGLVIGGAQSFMYLSDFRSFEPGKDITPCQESDPFLISRRDTSQSAKVLNVDRFLQELISKGVCLGCAPGFRRLDVEAAFSIAISDDVTFIPEP